MIPTVFDGHSSWGRGGLVRSWVLILLAVSISWAGALAGEDEDIDIYASAEYTYDDNVDLVETNEDSDSILSFIAGFDLMKGSRSQKLLLSYQFRYRDYSDRTEYDQPEHVFYAAYKLRSQRWQLSVEDRLLRTEDPEGFEFTARQKRVLNDAKLSFRMQIAREGYVTLGYENTMRDYRQSAWDHLSGAENAGSAEVAIPITESGRTQAFASVTFGKYRFDEDVLNGYSYVRGVAGLRGEPGAKLAFEVGVGVSDLDDFEDNLVVVDDDEATELCIFARATWRLKPERTRLELTLSRDDQPSTTSNYQVVTAGTLHLVHKFTDRISADAGLSVEDGDRSKGDDYGLSKAWAGLRHGLGRMREGDYQGDLYLRYEHAARDSSGTGTEYDSNRISVGYTYRF